MLNFRVLFSVSLLVLFLLSAYSKVSCEEPARKPRALSAQEIKQHLETVSGLKDYKNIVKPGSGVGLGGVIAVVQDKWEQICFRDGLCINVIKTKEPVETSGGTGCHKVKRIAYTIREIASQMAQQYGNEITLISLMTDLADIGEDVGLDMLSTEKCSLNAQCNIVESVQKTKKELARMNQVKKAFDAYWVNFPDIEKNHPEIKPIIDYQTHQINQIVQSISTVFNEKRQRMEFVLHSELKAQNAAELCNASTLTKDCQIHFAK